MMKEALKWMQPGIKVKRWIILILFGLIFVALGIAIILVHVYKTVDFPGISGPVVQILTAQHLPHVWRAVLLILGGTIFAAYGSLKFQKTILEPFLSRREKLFDTIKSYHTASRGPRIATIGGGTGMSLLLRGLKKYTNSLTAIVTVADSGGSSGRLRKGFGILPPGDLRQNIIALADTESLMAKLFDYRFEGNRYGEGLSLEGQNFGNLFLVAMNNITGDFVSAISESSHILNIQGRVLPSTTTPITLCARLESGEIVKEEENIDLGNYKESPIKELFLEPGAPKAQPEAVEAILNAEIIVLGPGDLYTSLLPNLLVPQINDAIKKSTALKFFICNVANKPTETKNFKVTTYVKTIFDHTRNNNIIDYVLVNDNFSYPPRKEATPYVTIDREHYSNYPVKFIQDDFIDPTFTVRHDTDKIARKVMSIFKERTF